MNIQEPLSLLGGLSPETFMRRHWQKKPLLIRGAIPGFGPILDRAELIDLAARDDVESRLVAQADTSGKSQWRLRHGPFTRKMLPAFKQAAWTLLVQGVDGHDARMHALINQFRFVPDARLDDLMISYATDGGGVGPHFDSYDVFLLQAHGRRRWKIGRQKDLRLQPNLPLKILANFEPEQEFDLEPGDMLYLPPRYAHDGIALGECMTYSIGFRSPAKQELAREILQRLAEHAEEDVRSAVYADPQQSAVDAPAQIPRELVAFASQAVAHALRNPLALSQSLGEFLTEPKARVWFESNPAQSNGPFFLDRRTRMLYDEKYIYLNGESFRASGKDAKVMRKLANERSLSAADVAGLSADARELLLQWCQDGWMYGAA
jgi:50S ribosomal protein L16 3-hydroxylase